MIPVLHHLGILLYRAVKIYHEISHFWRTNNKVGHAEFLEKNGKDSGSYR